MSGSYEIVYADFPWPYTSFGTAKLPYRQMRENEIAEFPWAKFLAPRAIVFSWATGPRLDMALRVGEEWRRRHGLHYQGVAWVWIKTTKEGKPLGAAGPRPRLVKPLAEFVLAFSTTPSSRTFPLLTESEVQWVFAPKDRVHSRKPPEVRDRIVGLVGDRPRIELFARGPVPEGWDAWGDEAQ